MATINRDFISAENKAILEEWDFEDIVGDEHDSMLKTLGRTVSTVLANFKLSTPMLTLIVSQILDLAMFMVNAYLTPGMRYIKVTIGSKITSLISIIFLACNADVPEGFYDAIKQAWKQDKQTGPKYIAKFNKINGVEFEKQSSDDRILTAINRILGVLLGLAANFIPGKIFANVSSGIKTMKDLESLSGDFFKDLLGLGIEQEQRFQEVTDEYQEKFTRFLELPQYVFARNENSEGTTALEQIRQDIEECTNFIRTCPKEMKKIIYPLEALIGLVTKRKNEIMQNVIPGLSRQEPFVVLFCGPGAIGKTTMVKELIRRSMTFVDGCVSWAKSVVEIRADDKYWPPLNGQPIAFFDESAVVKDLRTDLLWSGLKGICSQAFYNCPAADVEHKVTPCPFKLIFTTTNTDFGDISSRIAKAQSVDAIPPTWRRILAIKCEWNEDCGKLDPNNPQNHREDFSHIRMQLMQWNDDESQMEPQHDLQGVHDLLEKIRVRYQRLEREHKETTARNAAADRALALALAEKQSEHVMHFAAHLHGKPGHGKTPMINETAKKLAVALRLPLYHIKTLSQLSYSFGYKRGVYVFDDVFDTRTSPEMYQELMTIYNKVIPSNSLLLFASNIPVEFSWVPHFSTLFQYKRKHNIPIQGCVRRLGFVGTFTDHATPEYNYERIVVNGKLYAIKPNTIDPLTMVFNTTENKIRPIVGLYLAVACILLMRWELIPVALLAAWLYTLPRYSLEETTVPLADDIYNSYQSFLGMRNDFIYQKVEELPDIEYNYIIKIPKLQDFDYDGQFATLFAHTVTDRKVFDARNDWAMYVQPQVAQKLVGGAERFLISRANLTRDLCLEEFKRCARLFKEYNIVPKMRVSVDQIGTFAIDGNNLYELNNGTTQQLPQCAIVEETICIYGTQLVEVPIDTIISGVDITAKFNLSFEQAIALAKFLESADYTTNPVVVQKLKDSIHDNIKAHLALRYKQLQDTVQAWLNSPLGTAMHICYTLTILVIGLYTSYKVVRSVIGLCSSRGSDVEQQKNKHRIPHNLADCDAERQKRTRRIIPHNQADCDAEKQTRTRRHIPHNQADCDAEKQKLKGRQIPHNQADCDAEKQIIIQPRQLLDNEISGIVGIPSEKQMVKTFPHINGYDPIIPVIEHTKRKADKALSYIYIIPNNGLTTSAKIVDTYNPTVYGLIVKDKLCITVGHMVPVIKRGVGYAAYVANDINPDILYRMKLVKHCKQRDLSLWTVEDKTFPAFPDITKSFVRSGDFEHLQNVNTVLVRPGPNGESILLGDVLISREEDWIAGERNKEFGSADFGIHGASLTTGGDCGLPYLSFETSDPKLQNKIFGIHTAGNKTGMNSIGIFAIIYQEDIELKDIQLQANDCKFCANTDMTIAPAAKPKCDGHEIIWNAEHETSKHSFAQEIEYMDKLRPGFTGAVVKNSGPLFYGTEQHSHLQLMPEIEISMELTNGKWQTGFAGQFNDPDSRIPSHTTVSYICMELPWVSFKRCLRKHSFANYRLHANVFYRGNVKVATVFIMTPSNTLNKQNVTKQATLTLSNNEEVYVCGEVFDFIQPMIRRAESGKLPDVPFERVLNNETVKVLGVAMHNLSPIPRDEFQATVFAKDITLTPTKVPVRFDTENAAPELLEGLEKNRSGDYCGRITGSLQWAHLKSDVDPSVYATVAEEFEHHILQYYNGLSLLTQDQVLKGYPQQHVLSAGLQGMELDSSIGVTVKNLFKGVSKKSDIISLDERGAYTWKDNPASKFVQTEFERAKSDAAEGKRFYTCFNELCKSEKLKPSKEFKPRTFTAQDVVGILMERYVMGEFTARAMLHDPHVGVGTNAYTDFHKIYSRLRQHPNVFACDFTKFDRTIPAWVFQILFKSLGKINPHMKPQFQSMYTSLIERLQISGNTLFQVSGGMPSGALITAPGNSLCNLILFFSAWIEIHRRARLEHLCTWHAFIRNVESIFYGDDGCVSVSNISAKIYNAVTIAEVFKTWGMTMTPAEKGNELVPFDDWEELSFISRTFRRLENKPFIVGALKHITINTLLKWTRCNTPSQLAQNCTNAQFEAALWDQSYFDEVQDNIRKAVAKVPGILKYFSFRKRQDIQDEIYYQGTYRMLERQSRDCKTDPACLMNRHTSNYQSDNNPNDHSDILRAIRNHITTKEYKNFFSIAQKRRPGFRANKHSIKTLLLKLAKDNDFEISVGATSITACKGKLKYYNLTDHHLDLHGFACEIKSC